MESVFHNSQTRQRHENAKEAIMSSRKHHRSDVNDELNMLRWVAGMDEQLEKPKTTRHGWRHKSVGDRSSRVWEATRRVFRGSTRGSKPHHSHYRNGGERPCQNVLPSVIFGDQSMKTSVKNETGRTILLSPDTCIQSVPKC